MIKRTGIITAEQKTTMSVTITSLVPGSRAERAGIAPGQQLVEINGHPVQDRLDYQFLIHDEHVRLVIRDQAGEHRSFSFQKKYEEDIGLQLPEIRPRICQNRCIFCFVDQMPPGMRESLYVKDEDYRLSFLQGSYITLTGLREGELERIIDQRLSPLYISVHSTDEQVRRRLLGRDDIPNITQTISRLAQGNVQMHCQLVICPGFNDGSVLAKSVNDLSRFFPAVQSVAVVPVGLTGHRQNLYPLRSMGPVLAKRLLKEIEGWQGTCRRKMGIGFVYPADEVFLLAGQTVPGEEYYDGFQQLENGVGMMRQFLNLFEKRQLHYPDTLSRPTSVTIVTGQLAAPVLRQTLVARLLRIRNLKVQLRAVPNRFFGGGVTVSGLLTGRDILHSLMDQPAAGMLILPPNCLNGDGLFLDDLHPRDLEERMGIPVRVSPRAYPLRVLEEVLS